MPKRKCRFMDGLQIKCPFTVFHPSRMWQTATKGVQMKLWEEEREDRELKNDERREN